MEQQAQKQIEFLKKLQESLRFQEENDYDAQAAPRFWTVGDYSWEPCWEEHAERWDIFTPCSGSGYESFDELRNELLTLDANDYDWSKEVIETLEEISQEDDLLDWVKEHYDEDAYMVPMKKVHVIKPNTMFLTKEEAKRHIQLNHYHYSDEAHTYAMTAWRAPVVEQLLDLLKDFDWNAVEVKESAK